VKTLSKAVAAFEREDLPVAKTYGFRSLDVLKRRSDLEGHVAFERV
jgi:hypothetical protein